MGWVEGFTLSKITNKNKEININAPEYMVEINYNSEFDYSLSYEERDFTISSKEEIINFSYVVGYVEEFEEQGYSLLDEQIADYLKYQIGYRLKYKDKDNEVLFNLKFSVIDEQYLDISEGDIYKTNLRNTFTEFDHSLFYELKDNINESINRDDGFEMNVYHEYKIYKIVSTDPGNEYEQTIYTMMNWEYDSTFYTDFFIYVVKTSNKEKWENEGYTFIDDSRGMKMMIIQDETEPVDEDFDPDFDTRMMKIKVINVKLEK